MWCIAVSDRVTNLVASRLRIPTGLTRFPDLSVGDGILDGIIHNSDWIHLYGESLRKIHTFVVIPST